MLFFTEFVQGSISKVYKKLYWDEYSDAF